MKYSKMIKPLLVLTAYAAMNLANPQEVDASDFGWDGGTLNPSRPTPTAQTRVGTLAHGSVGVSRNVDFERAPREPREPREPRHRTLKQNESGRNIRPSHANNNTQDTRETVAQAQARLQQRIQEQRQQPNITIDNVTFTFNEAPRNPAAQQPQQQRRQPTPDPAPTPAKQNCNCEEKTTFFDEFFSRFDNCAQQKPGEQIKQAPDGLAIPWVLLKKIGVGLLVLGTGIVIGSKFIFRSPITSRKAVEEKDTQATTEVFNNLKSEIAELKSTNSTLKNDLVIDIKGIKQDVKTIKTTIEHEFNDIEEKL